MDLDPAKRYLVLGRRPWNRQHFDAILANQEGQWTYIENSEALDSVAGQIEQFDFVFVLHWSDRIPASLIQRVPFVCFHMTDVPYGRGGSPLQNLIVRGHRSTKLTALQMTEDFDAGPVYLKQPLSLEGGTAEEIFQRASRLACEMILQIVSETLVPVTQTGEIVNFKRRRPSESRLPTDVVELSAVHDHIRMLDADGYPKAFVEIGNLRIEFSRAALYHDGLLSDARITVVDPSPHQDSKPEENVK